jgi:O-antigen/teichoic acid export membrane protein
LLLILSAFGERIHGLWLGSRVPFDSVAMGLLLAHVVQGAVWGVSKGLLMSVNRHEALSKLVSLTAVVSLGACAWGGSHFGPAGLAGGLLVSELALPFWIAPWLVSRCYREFPFGPLLLEAVPAALTVALVFFVPALGWAGVVLLGALFSRSLARSGLLSEGRRASIPRRRHGSDGTAGGAAVGE